MNLKMLVPAMGLAIAGGLIAPAAVADTTQGGVTTHEAIKPQKWGAAAGVEFSYNDATVMPMPLPMANTAPMSVMGNVTLESMMRSSAGFRRPEYSPGSVGSGEMDPVSLGSAGSAADAADAESNGAITPQEYGSASKHPYTTSRVDVSGSSWLSKQYPYRAAGKLYFTNNGASYVCSASLIKRGIVVTAAHCVAQFGTSTFFSGWQFVPGKFASTAPYGVWNVSSVRVMASYLNGTDSCYQAGVICTNDVAVLTITPKSGAYPGASTGWFGYGVNGFGFAGTTVQVSQLGYPSTHDAGLKMQRTDSFGFVSTTMSKNTIWGSRQTGGSSGGPELVNLGVKSALSGVTLASSATFNIVIGVTSWGYTDATMREQGSSPFLSTNITAMVNAACAATPAACAP